ncbi:MAG: hypothetical protein ACTSW4_04420 [Candidatus Ranarchaeia archaeon]
MPKTDWPSIPLRNLVLDLLSKNHGIILDDHLTKLIEKERGKISPNELNRILMRLEIQGLIHVKQTTPTKRLIEIVKPDDQYMVVGED